MQYIKSNRIYFEDGCKAGFLAVDEGKIVGYFDESADIKEYWENSAFNRFYKGLFRKVSHWWHNLEVWLIGFLPAGWSPIKIQDDSTRYRKWL